MVRAACSSLLMANSRGHDTSHRVALPPYAANNSGTSTRVTDFPPMDQDGPGPHESHPRESQFKSQGAAGSENVNCKPGLSTEGFHTAKNACVPGNEPMEKDGARPEESQFKSQGAAGAEKTDFNTMPTVELANQETKVFVPGDQPRQQDGCKPQSAAGSEEMNCNPMPSVEVANQEASVSVSVNKPREQDGSRPDVSKVHSQSAAGSDETDHKSMLPSDVRSVTTNICTSGEYTKGQGGSSPPKSSEKIQNASDGDGGALGENVGQVAGRLSSDADGEHEDVQTSEQRNQPVSNPVDSTLCVDAKLKLYKTGGSELSQTVKKCTLIDNSAHVVDADGAENSQVVKKDSEQGTVDSAENKPVVKQESPRVDNVGCVKKDSSRSADSEPFATNDKKTVSTTESNGVGLVTEEKAAHPTPENSVDNPSQVDATEGKRKRRTSSRRKIVNYADSPDQDYTTIEKKKRRINSRKPTKKRKLQPEPSAYSLSRPRRGKNKQKTQDELLDELASFIVQGKKVVFLTGAGLSVASGIPPFRGQDDAVWEQSVHSWGTRKKFEEGPLIWYNTFWLKHFDESKASAYKPNAGHIAIAEICSKYPETTNVITQNVDRLHLDTVGKVAENQLIEVHGYTGAFKCYTPGCSYGKSKVHFASLGKHIRKQEDGSSYIESAESLPKCPECTSIMCPNCLLFDEDYSHHESYQFKKAKAWLKQADVIVFVGTSFAVQITNMAFAYAGDRAPAASIFNFNMVDNIDASKQSRSNISFISGRSELTLPQLSSLV